MGYLEQRKGLTAFEVLSSIMLTSINYISNLMYNNESKFEASQTLKFWTNGLCDALLEKQVFPLDSTPQRVFERLGIWEQL